MTAPPPGAVGWATEGRARLAVALDTPDADRALAIAAAVAPHCDLLKVGLELFTAAGPDAVRRLSASRPVFLDLKLHDIPNTVAGAVRALLPLRPALLTLHAAGGSAMFQAAREAAAATGDDRPLLLAVTVLTSFDAAALAATGVVGDPARHVARLARLALAGGADGLVCAAAEVPALRAEFGPDVPLVVPGIRPAGDPAGDQARVATPEAAVAAGADVLVVGRPITSAVDPGAACAAIFRMMGAECRSR